MEFSTAADLRLQPFRDARGTGAIVFDPARVGQASAAMLDPGHWGAAAAPVSEGGRGAAWFVRGGFGEAVLQGQTMNLYTGGSLFMRMPKRTYQLATVTPPSWNAGCGGIDLFAGGFSYINKEQFVAMLRNIGSNALGYGFKLAIQNQCPTCDNVMQALQAIAAHEAELGAYAHARLGEFKWLKIHGHAPGKRAFLRC